MWVSLLPSICCRNKTNLLHAAWRVVHFGALLLFLVPVGCSTNPKPGVTYNVSIITLGSDGELAPQGPLTRVQSAAVHSETKITHEGSTFLLLCARQSLEK